MHIAYIYVVCFCLDSRKKRDDLARENSELEKELLDTKMERDTQRDHVNCKL